MAFLGQKVVKLAHTEYHVNFKFNTAKKLDEYFKFGLSLHVPMLEIKWEKNLSMWRRNFTPPDLVSVHFIH